ALARWALARWALGAACGLALLGTAGCGDAPAPPVAAVADEDAWTFVGDETCASCHGDYYDRYHRTGMGRSVSLFDAASAPERFGPDGRSPLVCEPVSGYCYQAERRGDALWQIETRPDDPAYRREYRVSHVVGSGNATRSYFMALAAPDAPGAPGYVTEMPLTWYVERGIWDLSPGYAQANDRFERPISLECMTCHNGTPAHEPSLNFFADVPLGITCERCHGPASAHVEAFLADEQPADPRIVNPARLPVALQLDVCQQCHLTGETVFKPGHDPTTYRPGRPLSAHRAVFVTTESLEDPEAFGIASHAERMMRSACFDPAAPRPMTCTTCHDPHTPTAEMPAGHFNAACLGCHAGQTHPAAPGGLARSTPAVRAVAQAGVGGGAPPRVAMSAAGDCVSCHMRKGGTSDIPHVTFTDHWIQRRPPPARGVSATGVSATGDAYRRRTPFTLVDVVRREAGQAERGSAEADVEAAMAYFRLYDTRHRLPDYLPEIVRRLRRALEAGPVRPEAHLVLGRALLEQGALAEAEAALARAVAAAPADPFAHYWLGAARLRAGTAEAAIGPLREAVARAP
ncbi:MAG: tetratricopeptide repeat protein, partial [Rubricoccaceae bacterium]